MVLKSKLSLGRSAKVSLGRSAKGLCYETRETHSEDGVSFKAAKGSKV